MKKLIIFFVISSVSLYCQDYEPAQIPFNFQSSSNYYLSAESTYFKQDKFILGWAWSCGKKMSEVMLDNQAHVGTHSVYLKSMIKNNTNLIICPNEFYDNGFGLTGVNSQAMCYSPILRITNPGAMIGNPQKFIFGFQHINGETIGSNDVSLKLRTTGSYISSTQSVLDSVWAGDYLYWYGTGDPPPAYADKINTILLYFVINLKRSNPNDNTQDDTHVLKIKLPYQISGLSGYIQFDSIPAKIPGKTFPINSSHNNEFRGNAREDSSVGTGITEFYITRSMLPLDTANVTISAHFICDGLNFNPKLNIGDTLGIQVFYLGNTDVNINHVYFATNNARKTFFGGYDETIINAVQTELTGFSDTSYSNNGVKIFRFNTRDEIGPAYFGMQRYINKLIGNVTTTQSSFSLPRLYEYYVNAPEQWTETHRIDPGAVPYFRNPANKYLTFGGDYQWGYAYIHGSVQENVNDTLNSGFETHLVYYAPFTNMRDSSEQYYQDILSYSFCYQKVPENFGYSMIKDEKGIPLFSDRAWWGESFCGSNFSIDKTIVGTGRAILPYNRPKTGEETRYCDWIDLILGAKGLLYDREQTSVFVDRDSNQDPIDTTAYLFGVGYGQPYYNTHPLDTMNSNDFIYDDRVGSDFLQPSNDFYGFHKFISADSSSAAMGVNINRIYLGIKSSRAEIFKIHKWVRANDSVLMRLRLACWYGKGFKTWLTQDTARFGSTNLLTQLIDTSRTKLFTKKIWNPATNSIQISPENFDSMFTDITVLRDKDDTTLSSQFFIGLQNRRTDPLIFPQDTIEYYADDGQGIVTPNSYVDHAMRFYSTAEFDNNAINGDSLYFVPPDYVDNGMTYTYDRFRSPLYWKNMFWRRLGCRELHIPFKYTKSSTADNYTLLHITELGYNDTTLAKETWRQKPYYHLIDTIVHRDSTLIVRLLPGEGKILRCEVLRSPYNEGYLSYSNQRKMVAYPDTQITRTQIPTDTARYRYHAVFYKPISGDSRYGVYYMRSFPMKSVVNNNQIDWEPTNYLLSDSIIVQNMMGLNDTIKTKNCKYPSLVVRYDSNATSNSIKVYVVFACENPFISGNAANVFIVENIFNANGAYINKMRWGRRIAIAHCDTATTITRWGTPSINGSYNGNFYTWSDSAVGIVTGFKAPDAISFSNANKDTLHWLANPLEQIARHPSLNTYSRILSGETDCALVWQEKRFDSSDNYSNIHYSRLRVDPSGKLIHYVPKRQWSPTTRFFARYNVDSSMIHLTNNELDSAVGPFYYYKYMYPVIYRGVEIGAQCCYPDIKSCHTDRVFWQGTDEQNTDVIWITGLQLKDTVDLSGEWLPDCWNINGLSSIRSANKSLYFPDAAQGCMSYLGGDQFDNKGDSIVVTNFVQMNFGVPPSDTGKIWQVWSNYDGFFSDYATIRNEYVDYKYAKPVIGKGGLPHLAALPVIKDDSVWRRNRRIYEASNDESTSRIVTSLEWFYRRNQEESELAYPFFGYVHDTSKTMFSYAYLQADDGITIRPFIKAFEGAGSIKIPLDTIYSDWFKVKDYNRMKFYGFNKGTQLINVVIERQKDKRKYRVETPILSGKTIKHDYHLFNGGNNQYRLLFVKNIRNSIYREELIIDGLPDISDFNNNFDNDRFGRVVEETPQQFIDLGDMPEQRNENSISLSIFPNPADENVYATAYVPLNTQNRQHSLIIKVYSSLGFELFRQEVKSGETISIQTKDYPQGAYFIRAEEKTDDYTIDVIPAQVQGFVIKR